MLKAQKSTDKYIKTAQQAEKLEGFSLFFTNEKFFFLHFRFQEMIKSFRIKGNYSKRLRR